MDGLFSVRASDTVQGYLSPAAAAAAEHSSILLDQLDVI